MGARTEEKGQDRVSVFADAAGGRKSSGGIGIVVLGEGRETFSYEFMLPIASADQIQSELTALLVALSTLKSVISNHKIQVKDTVFKVYSDSQPALRAIESHDHLKNDVVRRLARRVGIALRRFKPPKSSGSCLCFLSAKKPSPLRRYMARANDLSRLGRKIL